MKTDFQEGVRVKCCKSSSSDNEEGGITSKNVPLNPSETKKTLTAYSGGQSVLSVNAGFHLYQQYVIMHTMSTDHMT